MSTMLTFECRDPGTILKSVDYILKSGCTVRNVGFNPSQPFKWLVKVEIKSSSTIPQVVEYLASNYGCSNFEQQSTSHHPKPQVNYLSHVAVEATLYLRRHNYHKLVEMFQPDPAKLVSVYDAVLDKEDKDSEMEKPVPKYNKLVTCDYFMFGLGAIGGLLLAFCVWNGVNLLAASTAFSVGFLFN